MIKQIFIFYLNLKFRLFYKLRPQACLDEIFNLFRSPQKGKFKQTPEFLARAKKKTVQSGALDIQTYQWDGRHQHILLLHGWQSNSSRWKGLVDALSKQGYKITAVDLPAHGNSEGKRLDLPLISQLLSVCMQQFSPDMIIAHSLAASGVVYKNWVCPFPENLRLILLAPPGHMLDLLENFRSILRLPQKIIDQLNPLVRENTGVSIEDCSIPEFGKSLSQKGYILQAENDKIVPVSAAKKLNNHWDKGNLVLSKTSGHSLNDAYSQKTILTFVENLFQ